MVTFPPFSRTVQKYNSLSSYPAKTLNYRSPGTFGSREGFEESKSASLAGDRISTKQGLGGGGAFLPTTGYFPEKRD